MSTSTSASPPISRKPSNGSLPQFSRSDKDSAPKRRAARNLLREYYGIQSVKEDKEASENSLDINSAAFDPKAYFENLVNTASVPELMKRHSEILTEIRELDGERQSLVYNHHHELVDGSDTIRKMKARAETLDSSLESLRTCFSNISRLSSSLASSSLPLTVPTKPPSPSEKSEVPIFSPTRHLPPLLSLPLILQSLISESHILSTASDGASEAPTADTYDPLIKSRELWGIWEPTIRAWEEAGVKGVDEVGRECREILRRERRGSNEHI